MVIILAIVFLAYGLTIRMFVWQDDHAIMFKLQNVQEPAGPFGHGVYDRSSYYRGVILYLYPIYILFKNYPAAYYVVGLFAYALASLSVYSLVKNLTKDKRVGIVSALVFASGHIGAETLWRIFNSIHTSMAIVMLCTSLVFYKKYIDTKNNKIVMYILSLILFTLAIETGLVRTHGIIILILAIELLWNFSIRFSPLRMLPFGLIYKHFYITGASSAHELQVLINMIFIDQQFELLVIPLRNLQNSIIPSLWRVPLWIFLIALLAIFKIVKQRKLLIFSLIFIVGNFLVYFIHTPTQVFPTIHRYLSVSAVGNGLFISLVFAKIIKVKERYYLASALVVITNLILVNRENIDFIRTKTTPTKRFYETLKQEVQTIPIGSAFYFDVKADSESISEFHNSFGVGSMPDTTAIAWQYNIDRSDITFARDFREILDYKNFYTFYYDAETGLVNTTDLTKQALQGDKRPVPLTNPKDIKVTYSSPLTLRTNIQTTIDLNKIEFRSTKIVDFKKYLDYIEAKKNFYNKAQVNAESSWENYFATRVLDSRQETSWKGDRLKWHNNPHEELMIDLGEKRTIGAAKLSHNSKSSTPTRYSYGCSLDKTNWTTLGQFYATPNSESGFAKNTFEASTCRFVKLAIKATVGNDSPYISELEIIDTDFKELDLNLSEKIEKNPFLYVSSQVDLNNLSSFLRKNGINSQFCYLTNKSTSPYCESIQLSVVSTKTYNLPIEPNGTILKSVEIVTPDTVDTKITNLKLNYLNREEL